MSILLLCVGGLLLLLPFTASAGDFQYPVEYSVDGRAFAPLGTLALDRMLDGNYTGTFRIHSPDTARQLHAELKESVQKESSLLNSSPSYRVRSGVDGPMSSNYACLFLLSRLSHQFNVMIEEQGDNSAMGGKPPRLLSLTLFPADLPSIAAIAGVGGMAVDVDKPLSQLCAGKEKSGLLLPDDGSGADKAAPPAKKQQQQQGTFKARVVVDRNTELPSPDTATYLQRLEEEKRARQHGAQQDNRSFLAKYWMYIVPVVLFMVISNAFSADQPQQQGGE